MSSVFMDLVRSLHQASVMVGGDLKFSMSSHSDEVQTSIIESCLLKVVIFSEIAHGSFKIVFCQELQRQPKCLLSMLPLV